MVKKRGIPEESLGAVVWAWKTPTELRGMIKAGIDRHGLALAWELASHVGMVKRTSKPSITVARAIWHTYRREGLVPYNQDHPDESLRPTTSPYWQKVAVLYNERLYANDKSWRRNAKAQEKKHARMKDQWSKAIIERKRYDLRTVDESGMTESLSHIRTRTDVIFFYDDEQDVASPLMLAESDPEPLSAIVSPPTVQYHNYTLDVFSDDDYYNKWDHRPFAIDAADLEWQPTPAL